MCWVSKHQLQARRGRERPPTHARTSGGTAREMMSTMEEGAVASPRPVVALQQQKVCATGSVPSVPSEPNRLSVDGGGRVPQEVLHL